MRKAFLLFCTGFLGSRLQLSSPGGYRTRRWQSSWGAICGAAACAPVNIGLWVATQRRQEQDTRLSAQATQSARLRPRRL